MYSAGQPPHRARFCQGRTPWGLIAYAPTRMQQDLRFPPDVAGRPTHSGVTPRTCRPCQPAASVEFLGSHPAHPGRCAACSSDGQAFVLACAGLARASHANPLPDRVSHALGSPARRETSSPVSRLPTNAREGAEWIVRNANAGCESPRGGSGTRVAPCRNFWAHDPGEIRCRDNTYFIDIALPALKIAISSTAASESGNTVEEVHDSVERNSGVRRLELEDGR